MKRKGFHLGVRGRIESTGFMIRRRVARISPFKRRLCLAVLMGAAFWAILGLLRIADSRILSDWAVLRDALLDLGAAGPLIFLLVVAVLPLVAPLSILIITGATSFGPVHGMLLSYAGAVLNASLTFFLVQGLGIEEKWGTEPNSARLKDAIRRRGFHLVLLLQGLSLIPFVAINSAAAASGIRWKDFMGATLLGVVPSIAINSFLGEAVVSRIFPPDIYFAFILLVLLAVITAAFVRHEVPFGRKGLQ